MPKKPCAECKNLAHEALPMALLHPIGESVGIGLPGTNGDFCNRLKNRCSCDFFEIPDGMTDLLTLLTLGCPYASQLTARWLAFAAVMVG